MQGKWAAFDPGGAIVDLDDGPLQQKSNEHRAMRVDAAALRPGSIAKQEGSAVDGAVSREYFFYRVG